MTGQAELKGYTYYAVTDHAPNLIMQRMTDEKMLAQRVQLAAISSSMLLLHGTERRTARRTLATPSRSWGTKPPRQMNACRFRPSHHDRPH
ncbi:MAG: hypothetical protein WBF20_15280 [Trebonia sp.]|uniref:hypothetical protein n=1 Tax=Trebonia sp. TaxID=2767075 RepID=UPI003C7186F7